MFLLLQDEVMFAFCYPHSMTDTDEQIQRYEQAVTDPAVAKKIFFHREVRTEQGCRAAILCWHSHTQSRVRSRGEQARTSSRTECGPPRRSSREASRGGRCGCSHLAARRA